MSEMATWTDEQLQSRIAQWEKLQQNGEQLDLTIYNKVVMNPWEGSGYILDFAGEHVSLTIPQAILVQEWLNVQIAKQHPIKPKARDVQFAGFAKLAWEEITAKLLVLDDDESISDGCAVCNFSTEKLATIIEPLIARQAYDLVSHGLDSMPFDYDWPMRVTIDEFPDMHQWPESEKQP